STGGGGGGGGAGTAAEAAEPGSSDGDGGAGRRSSGGGSVGAGGAGVSIGSGGGGGGGGGGYIVSFKKDQDGYMRLRLEALLMEWPKEHLVGTAGGGTTITSTALPSAVVDTNSAGLLSLGATTDCSSTTSSTVNDLTVIYSSGPRASLDFPSGLAVLAPSFSGPLPSTSFSGVAALPLNGSGGSGGPISDVGSPPLEQELMRRFPPPAGAPAGSEQVTIAAAKRCIARLLAWAPPPHQLTFAKLGAQVPKLLGGARIGRNLRLICLEEPDVFAVQSQSPTVYVVRLVCPRLLQLAQEQSERKHASSQQPQQTFQQTHLLTNQPPPPPPPQQQQQPSSHTLPKMMQVVVPQQHAIVPKQLQLATVQPGQVGGGIGGGGGALAAQLQQLQLHQPQQHQMQGLVAGGVRLGTCTAPQPQNPLMPSHPQLRIATVAQRLLLQPQGQGAELEQDTQQQQQPYIRTATQLVSSASSTSGELGRSGSATWSTTWQQQPQQQPPLLLLQPQSQAQGPQQQQPGGISTLRHQSSLGSNNGGGGTARLYDDRLSLNGSTPRPSLSSVGSLGGRDGFSASNLSLDSAQLTSWHGGGGAVGGGGGGGGAVPNNLAQHQHQHSQTQHLQQFQQQQQQMAVAAAAAAAAAVSRKTVGQRLHDFAASALVAEQALQQQHAQTHGGGAVTSTLHNTAAVHILSNPYSPDFLAVMQHCHACAQIGIAVQVYDGRPALVSLYAPSAMAMAGGVDSGASGGGAGGAGDGGGGGAAVAAAEAWPPAVYVLDCTASSASEGPEAMVGVLLGSLRGLLEEPGVAKVVHGCEQVRALEVTSGASIAPLLDTSILLSAILTMLPPLPPPPPAAAVAVAAAAGALPAGGYSSTEAAAVAQLCAHVAELRAVLQSVELWTDRPELLALLGEVHFAAHRAELWAAAGRDSNWLSRPLSEGQVAVAAQSVRHLPELWAALCEAVPWLAAHAALRVMQHLRSSSAAAAAVTVMAGMRVAREV
ncbi:hypothetical protein Vretifemale_18086, partial [Volvox reticuliferus]